MKALPTIGALLAVVASVLLLRIVIHGYTGHGHLDVFHLAVAIASALAGLLLARRAFLSRGT